MSRLPALRVSELNESQLALYNIVKREPREFVQGPIRALLLSPVVGEKIQSFGAVIHAGTTLGPKLTELAVLVVARAWTCQYEWFIHAPLAAKHGVPQEIIEAIRTRAEPEFENDQEAVLYALVQAMASRHRVSDQLYESAKTAFGERGVSELVAMTGYFALLAMTMNCFELGLPEGTSAPLPV